MALEPVAGQVYFSPECHAAYAELGFSPSPGSLAGGVQLPDGAGLLHEPRLGAWGRCRARWWRPPSPSSTPTRWCRPSSSAGPGRRAHHLRRPDRRRGGPAGARPRCRAARGSAAPPSCWRRRWRRCGPRASRCSPGCEPRAAGRSDGRPVAPGRPAARVPGRRPHRGLDVGRPRRHRGRPAHRALLGSSRCAPTSAPGPGRTTQLDEAEGRLAERGLVADGGLTAEGRALRESVEVATDAQCEVIVDALGERFDELIGLLTPWGAGHPRRRRATRRRARTTWPRCADRVQASGRCSVPAPGVMNRASPGSWTRAVCQTFAG